MLSGLIKDIPGIISVPVTGGGCHSYWEYCFKIVGSNAKEFVKALIGEGVLATYGYTGKPIYLCMGCSLKIGPSRPTDTI
ncbi:MAG: hypothetical protein FGF53_02530 [Candidatus Brockarchaeota archaeon]|nr:hypothetical protein [Candidatus Brockarchaeota archaeon]MBO3808809.1 hypothetical protein [Candidatus Brockarchaeota archaeon]